MRRTGGFPPAQMTRSQNRLAFKTWVSCCTDAALERAQASNEQQLSLSRSYGVSLGDVATAINHEVVARMVAYRAARG